MRPLQRIVRDVAKDHLMKLQASSFSFVTDDRVEHQFIMHDPLFSSNVKLNIDYDITKNAWTIEVICPRSRRSVYNWFLEEIHYGMKRGGYKVKIAPLTTKNAPLASRQRGSSSATRNKT